MEQPKAHPKPSEPANIPSRRTQQTRNIWAWGVPSATTFNEPKDTVLFSSSLPSALSNKREHIVQPMDIMFPVRKQLGTYNRVTDTMDDVAQHLIGNLLPDNEEELLAGVINDFDHVRLQNQAEELEEYDVFHNSGGMELDFDPLEIVTFSTTKASVTNNIGSGSSQYNLQTAVGTVTGEHPFGEHPSRTLFVRNINSNVEDSELCSLFEPFGDIRSMYTATKHRGFVMISYYDIRDARTAMRALQNKPLRRRKLDIHFSIPKENPSDKDMNQGTLVIFNLEPAVSNEELLQIFGVFGEVREIRETPQKRHHRFIEFYDVRAAEAALRSLNKSDIAGKRVKLEPSRPGGARRSFVQPSNYDFDQDETRHNVFHFGSPSANSAPSLWSQIGSPIEHNQLNTHSETSFSGGMSPLSVHICPIAARNAKIVPIITFMVPSGHQSTSYVRPSKFGSIGPSHVGGSLMTNFGLRSQVNAQSMQSVGFNGLFESGQNHAVGNTGGQEDSRMQYQLDLEKIVTGEDTRTTLVIKNIPNKYTQKMLLDVIDETHERTYDFFYLPVDLKNKCNVGYAFINMIYPSFIVSFHKAFTGHKWEKFNSEKVVSLAYARIQGKTALVNHFQNSSLMNEDKCCLPILFHDRHTENGYQILLDGTNISHKDGVLEGCDLSGDLKRGSFRQD
ncbi:hypothetical protein QOZ80_2BG0164800 [Eleusine coracana subsp. coracana]|nr:hypothetical protein QOZ80_2BG0164800 [Eleusine coracana subsp. coracana]